MSFWVSKPPASKTIISWESAEEDKAHDIIKYAKDVLQKVQNFLSSTQIPNEDLALADLLQKVEIDLDTYMQFDTGTFLLSQNMLLIVKDKLSSSLSSSSGLRTTKQQCLYMGY